jgi:hypothetical protein
MNGVAREFWSEVLDVKNPVEDERGGDGGRKQSGRKKTRKVLVRRGGDRRVG